ncbi:MAG: DUF58 domain-containing protein [Clostridiales bacterium]|nr:DUF58 domain-containing protein [Clostridiales bacterium]
MLAKRIAYALMVLASVVTLIITDSGIALFICVFLVCLPFVSLLTLSLAKRKVKFSCKVNQSCIRGNTLRLTVKVGVTPRFFVGTAEVVAEIENATFNKKEYKNFVFKDLSFAPHDYDYVSANSGKIVVRFVSIKLIDIFGVVKRTVKCYEIAESMVSPILFDNLQMELGVNKNESVYGENVLPQKGHDITEIYNIRDYQAGDSLSSVHWKLSGKFDALKTKDFGSTDDRNLLVLVDMSRKKFDDEATDDMLNSVLDAAVSVSNAMIMHGYAHTVGWFDKGLFGSSDVNDADSFVQMVDKLMSIKVDEGNAESLFYLTRVPSCSVFTKIIYVTTAVNTDELKQSVNCDITSIVVGNGFGEVDNGAYKIINVPYDRIATALATCVL